MVGGARGAVSAAQVVLLCTHPTARHADPVSLSWNALPGIGSSLARRPSGSGSGSAGTRRSTTSGWPWCMPSGVRKPLPCFPHPPAAPSQQSAVTLEPWLQMHACMLLMCYPFVCAGIASVMLWEAITPVSFALAVLPPLWVAWSLHDNLLRSPIFYGMLLMMPLKFVPGGPFRWI